MAASTSTKVFAESLSGMTPRERYIMRAVMRAIDEWDRLEDGERKTSQARTAPDDPEIDRLRAAILRDIG